MPKCGPIPKDKKDKPDCPFDNTECDRKGDGCMACICLAVAKSLRETADSLEEMAREGWGEK